MVIAEITQSLTRLPPFVRGSDVVYFINDVSLEVMLVDFLLQFQRKRIQVVTDHLALVVSQLIEKTLGVE
tara:strand:+ start:563 stop:772 length:210 start_codon:yes stop_codon:yes gene_type:complete